MKNRLASSGTSSSVDPESVSVKSDSDAIDSSDVSVRSLLCVFRCLMAAEIAKKRKVCPNPE